MPAIVPSVPTLSSTAAFVSGLTPRNSPTSHSGARTDRDDVPTATAGGGATPVEPRPAPAVARGAGRGEAGVPAATGADGAATATAVPLAGRSTTSPSRPSYNAGN